MSIDYATLTAASKTTEGSIRNWVNRDDIPVTNILIEAQAAIYESLRVREMTALQESFTFAINTDSVALPADFLDPIQFLPWQWGDPLPLYNEGSLRKSRDENGTLLSGSPSCWSIVGVTAHIDVSAVAAFSGELMYYALPAVLSGTNTTNFLTTRYPSLLRYACMMKAYEHMKKTDDAKGYMMLMMAGVQSAAASNDLFRRSSYAPT